MADSLFLNTFRNGCTSVTWIFWFEFSVLLSLSKRVSCLKRDSDSQIKYTCGLKRGVSQLFLAEKKYDRAWYSRLVLADSLKYNENIIKWNIVSCDGLLEFTQFNPQLKPAPARSSCSGHFWVIKLIETRHQICSWSYEHYIDICFENLYLCS